MSLYSTKFHTSWLEKLDSDGTSIKRWLKQGANPSAFICTLCKTDELSCKNKGWESVERHMNNKKHRDNLKLIKENSTFIIRNEPAVTQYQQGSSSSTVPMVTLTRQNENISFTDQVTRAEALWAINTARHGYSYRSCDDLGNLFRRMFPDSRIAEHYKMEQTKLSYVISHGLGPFFHRDLVQDIKKCERFVLCFDEQKNYQNSVVTRYYKSIFLGHAPAQTIRDDIMDSFRTDGIDIKHLLMVGRDNPNVNKAIEKLLDTELKQVGGELLKLGSCNIHVIHNAFKSGTTTSCWHAEDICIDLWSWFHYSPARNEDFVKIADDLNEAVEKKYSLLLFDYVDNKQGAELLLIDYKLAEKQFNDKQIKIDVRNILHSIASYLKLNLPLDNSFLRDIQILRISRRSDPEGSNTIVRTGRCVLGLLSSNEIDLLSNEWLMYSLEIIDNSWIIKRKYNDFEGKEHIEYHEIDYYWNKNILIISHGNSDVERDFSINSNLLTEERTLLSEKSINGLRGIFDIVDFFGDGSVHKLQSEQKAAQMLLEEGNQRLENALKKSKSGTEKIKSIDEEMTKIMEDVSVIQQKRGRAEREQLKKEK
ncbi:unnamed protein product [Rotaria sordida]|uniref:Uncharacterized protein n=1 Tax=Rotaria sordida TaxID=392033 RepID=A0A814JR16_9BILA|nr:unnamed protein product [Rotaria sordida]CAF1039171.1 unnamed protein product [Rotaria sordida]